MKKLYFPKVLRINRLGIALSQGPHHPYNKPLNIMGDQAQPRITVAMTSNKPILPFKKDSENYINLSYPNLACPNEEKWGWNQPPPPPPHP